MSKLKHNIEGQMSKYLVATMLLTLLTVAVTMLLSIGSSALNLLESNQSAIISGMQSLYNKTGLPIDELLETYPIINHSAVVVSPETLEDMPLYVLEKLTEGEIVYDSLYSTSLVTIGDQTLLITAYPLRNKLLQGLIITSIVLSSFFLAGVFLATMGSRRFTRSIVKLSRATKAVADGDFSVQLKETPDMPLEVHMLTHNFNLMVRELGKNTTLRKDFISAVSHEFKTPLAAIRGYATYANTPGISDEERGECLRIVLEETDALTAMTTNILKLCKLENQEIPEKSVEFMLDEQLRQCVLTLEPSWSKKNLELDIDLDEISYVGDDDLLRQVWINLLQNAIKFSNEGGTLGVKLCRAADGIHISISDTGIGMTKEVASHIFEKFYQGDPAHHSNGNGLGLSLVQHILKLVGGHIVLQSAPGVGSTFTVILPNGQTRWTGPAPGSAPQAIPSRTRSK